MRAFGKLTWIQAKLYLREPIATFFTIIYAPLVLVLFGTIYGNEPQTLFGGRGIVDVAVPAYIALIIVSVEMMSVPIHSRQASIQCSLLRQRVRRIRRLQPGRALAFRPRLPDRQPGSHSPLGADRGHGAGFPEDVPFRRQYTIGDIA